MAQVPTLLGDLQLVLLKQVIFNDVVGLELLAFPLLSLILAAETTFTAVTNEVVVVLSSPSPPAPRPFSSIWTSLSLLLLLVTMLSPFLLSPPPSKNLNFPDLSASL